MSGIFVVVVTLHWDMQHIIVGQIVFFSSSRFSRQAGKILWNVALHLLKNAIHLLE